VLFIGDLTTNVSGHMALPPYYENLGDERRSVRKLFGRSFEKVALPPTRVLTPRPSRG
jgi:hypothetical protein